MSDNTPISEWLSSIRSRLSGITEQQDFQTRLRDLEAVDRAIVEARKLRNAMAWPRTLPPELWIEIFSHLYYWAPGRLRREEPFELGWMIITHVCSSWREIALSAPILWTDLTYNVLSLPHHLVPDILARSRSTAMDVRFNAGWIDPTSLDLEIWMSPSIAQRLRSLYINGSLITLERMIPRLPRVMPSLSCLDISCAHEDFYTLPMPFPVEEAPQLRSLTLAACALPQESPLIFGSLTHLVIDGEIVYRPAYSTLSDILTLSSLESLELFEIVPINDTVWSSFPIIILSERLRSLRFDALNQGPGKEALAFLACLHFPSTCSCGVEIAVTDTDADDPVLYDAFKRLSPLLSFVGNNKGISAKHLSWSDTHRVSISSAGPHQAPLRFTPHQPHQRPADGVVVNDYRLLISSVSSEERSLVALMAYLTLDELQSVSIHTWSTKLLKDPSIQQVLLRAVDVRHLDIYTWSLPNSCCELLDILSQRHEHNTSNSAHFLFPKLDVLVFQFNHEEKEDVAFADAIVNFISRRRELGASLREVAIPAHVSRWAIWDTIQSSFQIAIHLLAE